MSKLVLILTVVLMGMAGSVKAGVYSGGSGTEEDPYKIGIADDLLELGVTTDDYDKHFIMTDDIDLSGYVFDRAVVAPDTPDTSDDFDGTSFTGVFNGDGYRIVNLRIDTLSDGDFDNDNNDYLGLFGNTKGHISNLGIENVAIAGGSASNYIGGLCGQNFGILSSCYATGIVSGNHDLGGLVGLNSSSASIPQQIFNRGVITKCYSSTHVIGETNIGGLVGHNSTWVFRTACISSMINNCYANGSIQGVDNVGGLTGCNSGEIYYAYTASHVSGTGSSVGGLVGYSEGEIIPMCGNGTFYSYWDTQTSGVGTSVCWGKGCLDYGRTTDQMHQQSTFTDWDFINVWDIGENQTYPYLRTVPASDINKDHITNLLDLSIMAEQWMRDE